MQENELTYWDSITIPGEGSTLDTSLVKIASCVNEQTKILNYIAIPYEFVSEELFLRSNSTRGLMKLRFSM